VHIVLDAARRHICIWGRSPVMHCWLDGKIQIAPCCCKMLLWFLSMWDASMLMHSIFSVRGCASHNIRAACLVSSPLTWNGSSASGSGTEAPGLRCDLQYRNTSGSSPAAFCRFQCQMTACQQACMRLGLAIAVLPNGLLHCLYRMQQKAGHHHYSLIMTPTCGSW
jgi:hypothetical protein